MSDNPPQTSKSRRLAEIVREVKVAAAERDDVVVEMRDADRARLELLAQELQPIINDIPVDDDQFDFALSSGLQPRFWVDAVAHVHMGRDRRTYRFVRDTRLGRSLISETPDMGRTADAVSRYIAERLIQRQRLLEGDFETLRTVYADRYETLRENGTAHAEEKNPAAESAPARHIPAAPPPAPPAPERSRVFLVAIIWFFVGCILGGLALMAAFADRLAN